MATKDLTYALAYTSVWVAILPFLLVGASLMFAFALLTELGQLLIHGETDSINPSGAREIAAFICTRG